MGEASIQGSANLFPRTHRLALLAAKQAMANVSAAPDAVVMGVTSGGLSSSEKLQDKAAGRINRITGSGGEDTADIIQRLYRRSHTGPMREFLIRLS